MSLLLDKEFPEGKIPSLPSLCSPGWVQSSVYTQQSICLPYSSFCNIQVFLPTVHTSPSGVLTSDCAYISSEEPARLMWSKQDTSLDFNGLMKTSHRTSEEGTSEMAPVVKIVLLRITV